MFNPTKEYKKKNMSKLSLYRRLLLEDSPYNARLSMMYGDIQDKLIAGKRLNKQDVFKVKHIQKNIDNIYQRRKRGR